MKDDSFNIPPLTIDQLYESLGLAPGCWDKKNKESNEDEH